MGVFAAARLPARPLHGVLQTIGTKALLLLRAAAGTSALLQPFEAVLVGRVAALPDDDAILHEHAIDAAPAAVVPARRRYPLALVSGWRRRPLLPLPVSLAGDERRRCRERCREHCAARYEAATAQRTLRDLRNEIPHGFPPTPRSLLSDDRACGTSVGGMKKFEALQHISPLSRSARPRAPLSTSMIPGLEHRFRHAII